MYFKDKVTIPNSKVGGISVEQLIIDIDKNIDIPEYELILCKPDKQEICVINANNIIFTPEFANIDELEFQVPLYIMDNHNKTKNSVFDLVKGDYLVQFNQSKYFIIKDIVKESTENGYEYKKVSCFSREFELSNKQIVDYVADSRKLYDTLNKKDENGIEWGIMNYIEKLTSWKVGYVKPNLLEKRRSFNIPRQNLIEAFKVIQETFSCLFQFDTNNKLINIYEVNDLGRDRGLYISDDKYIKSISENIKHGEVRTRLFLYGRDNVSINKLNPTGTFYLDNFNFYKTTDYMSQELIDALNNYDSLLQSKQGEFQEYLKQLDTLNEQLTKKENELFQLQVDLAIIEDQIETRMRKGQSYSDLNAQKATKQGQINSKTSEITNLNNQIANVNKNISSLKNTVKMENNFTQQQLEDLDYFIKEETYQDSNYTEENIQELYDKGQEILAKISQPPTEFSINVVDFLNIVECQHDWDRLVLGDIVTIQHDSLGVDIQVRLVGYSHDVDSNGLTLKFSNRNSIDDPNVYLKDLLSQMSSTSTQVDFSKFKWESYEEDKKSDIILYVDSELDAARNKILAGRGQDIEVGERGIICRDPNNPNNQIRILSDIIAMTNDGWKTAKTAISSQGIVAENIVGKLGVFAKVRADQIIVGDAGQTISDDVLGGSLVKQNTKYNQVTISAERGVVATHGDGSETILDGDGFKRRIKSNGNVYEYLSLSQFGKGEFTNKHTWYHSKDNPNPPTTAELDNLVGCGWVTIPNVDFKGKNFVVIPSFSGVQQIGLNDVNFSLGIDVEVIQYDYANARFKIRARTNVYFPPVQWGGAMWVYYGSRFSYNAFVIS